MTGMVSHLWQSTIFAALAALLAVTLRGNPARVRHWIWMAASVKFLLPFSLLVAIGMRVGPPRTVNSNVAIAVQEFAAPASAAAAQVVRPLPRKGAPVWWLVWAFGFTGIAATRQARWRKIRAVARDGNPTTLRAGIPVRSVNALVEPGVFGVFRPVLLLPEGIAERLTPEQLQAVTAHELCHVRRHDNLAAAIHMLVETIFWFHPLVWWIGARLADERERACDEQVLREGNEAEAYAEGILAACRFYLRSPLACVSGVSGADLRGRIERIMTGESVRELGAAKRGLVIACGVLAIAAPIAVGLATAPPSLAQTGPTGQFEVATVKPSMPNIRGMNLVPANGKLEAKNVPLEMLIAQAYDVYPFRLLNTPGWTRSARYDIQGKAADAQAKKSELLGMLRTLLAERFRLESHREKRDQPVYWLTLAKSGSKLKPPEHPDGWHGVDYRNGGTVLIGRNASMEELADALSYRTSRVVSDKTGLTGRYDFRLEFTPDEFVAAFGEDRATPIDANGTNLFTAMQEQLGLKLESGKGPVEMIVIDRVERPTEN